MRAGSLGARAFVALQYLLPQHLLSRGVRALTHWRWRPFSQRLIRLFLRGFRPDLSDALQPDITRYDSFNEFFVRELRPDARPGPATPEAIASPVDGTISALGDCTDGLLLQAKGRNYSLNSLLAAHGGWPERFAGGRFMTIYLAPYNYHRIHMPMRGQLVDAWYVPGQLFSVNAVTAAHVPNLFARNERLIAVFEQNNNPFAMVLVGALFVGSMGTVWHGDVQPARRNGITRLDVPSNAERALLERGAEMGRFNMGSTVILLLPPGGGDWLDTLQVGQTVRVGDRLGTRAT
jgi:phosphatidylserine decarboxylase